MDAQKRKTPGGYAITPEMRDSEQSPGRKEWRTKKGKFGPAIDDSFLDSSVLFPGRLHIYNLETEKQFTIHTNQGDSEILLIDKDVVYYRSSDKLYAADITADRVGKPRLIATDELIRDTHRDFYEAIKELAGVLQLDKLNADKAVILKKVGTETTLEAIPLP